MNSIRIKAVLAPCLFLVSSAIMLTVIQPPIGLAWVAWIAFVPFILVCSPSSNLRFLFAASFVISFFYWLGNLYWLFPVTAAGLVAFCLYTALLWPMLVFAVRLCRTKKIPLTFAVPILLVGAERLQGLFMGGFFWRHLSHSQYANITLIQISDIFGAAGVSFLIAMVNGLIADLIIAFKEKRGLKASSFLKTGLVFAALIAAIVYGRWRVEQSDKFIEDGPIVGSVQSNVPQSVKESLQAEDVILKDLLQSSSECIKAGGELIVWPETMVQATLDSRVLKLLDPSHTYKAVDNTLREHSKGAAFILIGTYGGVPQIQEDWSIRLTKRYNSAILYQSDGQRSPKQYDKIHLVPFGEVVPFKKSAPWLHKILMSFTPYDYDYSLDYGTEYTVFEMAASQEKDSQTYRFGVMICYEDAIPKIARKFAIDDQGQKLDWLVNISNDGWFVRFKNEKVFPSTELSQHTAVCVFRAVENRLAVLRSVNTGISCLIDTLGRIKNDFMAGTLPESAMKRKGIAGWFIDKMPIDKRRTFFSKYGQWLDLCCAFGLVLAIMLPVLTKFIRKKTLLRQTNKSDFRKK